MKKININEAKTNLSRYLRRIRGGETIILCRRNVPVAEIRPLAGAGRVRRRIGLLRGSFKVPPEFFEPLPEEMIARFEGGGGEPGARKTDP